MKTRMRAFTPAVAIVTAFLICPFLGGCKSGGSYRSSVNFHAEGVRLGIQRVNGEIARNPRDYYGMNVATDHLERALSGLPARIGKKATTRVEERKAKAEEAIKLFAALKPVLVGLQFDAGEVKAKLAELGRLIDEVEKT